MVFIPGRSAFLNLGGVEPMRIAALYDIHGNLPALEAVLQEVLGESVNLIVVGGDVFPGPMSGEALSLLLGLETPVRFLAGNGDREVLALADGHEPGDIPEAYRAAMRWVARQLEPEHARSIASWPEVLRLEIEGLGHVLFCHATPRNDTEIFTCSTPEQRLIPIFEKAGTPLVVCGHTHLQFDRMIGDVRVLNAGSVGMPFGTPGAYWLSLGPGVELRRTAYDLAKAAKRIRATRYPQADEFASRNILQPPSEHEMPELLARAEST